MKLRDILETDYDNTTGLPIDYAKEKRNKEKSRSSERRYKKLTKPEKKGEVIDTTV